MGDNVNEPKLEKQEIRNFKIALEHLLKDKFGEDFKQHIKIENPSYLDHE